MEEYISRAQAQRILGCDKNTIKRLLLSGDILSLRKDNGGWLVSRDSLNLYMAKRADSLASVKEMQRLLFSYQEENRVLKNILKEHGIELDNEEDILIPRIKVARTINDLNLPFRALHSLYSGGVRSIEQLRNMSAEDLTKIAGIGKKTARIIMSKLMFSDSVLSYPVITLCGSTRFKEQFLEAQKRLTLAGNIVISVGLFGHSGDDEVWIEGTKEMLDDMHKRKIDMADAIYVINVGGYIGQSTRSEIEYALNTGKEVRYLEPIE